MLSSGMKEEISTLHQAVAPGLALGPVSRYIPTYAGNPVEMNMRVLSGGWGLHTGWEYWAS